MKVLLQPGPQSSAWAVRSGSLCAGHKARVKIKSSDLAEECTWGREGVEAASAEGSWGKCVRQAAGPSRPAQGWRRSVHPDILGERPRAHRTVQDSVLLAFALELRLGAPWEFTKSSAPHAV